MILKQSTNSGKQIPALHTGPSPYSSLHCNRYKSRFGITTLATHPSQLCIATGNGRGEIKLWWVDSWQLCGTKIEGYIA